MLSQGSGKTPDFAKGIVEGRRGDADYVGFAKIAFHIGGFELLQ
jgi:hypothetical protein